jgi:hypothetical protein
LNKDNFFKKKMVKRFKHINKNHKLKKNYFLNKNFFYFYFDQDNFFSFNYIKYENF